MSHVYLDHNATTPVDPAVLEAMLPFLREDYGNASSRHELGTRARKALTRAREQVAALVGVQPSQVVFVSGGSEANNLFLKGAAALLKPSALAISAVEHPCVSRPARELARQGWTLRTLPVTADGQLDPAALASTLAQPTGLVSVMRANNETGVLLDVPAVAAAGRAAGAWVHTDAVQAAGKLPLDFTALGVHALSLSAHKLGGPKGSGALVLDKRIEVRPLISGGGHEGGLRAGTENVPAIVGFGLACELAAARLAVNQARIAMLRAKLEDGLARLGAVIFGAAAPRVPNTSYFAIPGVDGETLVVELDRLGFAVSAGSACSSAKTDPEPSHVLLAMGVAPELAQGAVRVSLGAATRAHEVEAFLAALGATVERFLNLTALAR